MADPIKIVQRPDLLGSVLVGCDFSGHSDLALRRAPLLPIAAGACVELLHVSAPDDTTPKQVAQHRLEAARAALRTTLEHREAEVRVVTSIAPGLPSEVLAEQGRASRAELIVLGRHGERSWRDLVMGATAERVIRHGSTSVLVVNSAARQPYRRPLVAVDLSKESAYALELVDRVSGDGVAIDLLHVIDYPSRLSTSSTTLVPALERRREELEVDAREHVMRFMKDLGGAARCEVSIQFGEPADKIMEHLEQRRNDLVVVGSHGRSGVRRLLLGSVAERVLHRAACDVLIARLPEL